MTNACLSLPIRREPLWLAVDLRPERRHARAQRIETGEDLEVRPDERWQSHDRRGVEQLRIEVGPGGGRSQGGMVRIQAEDDLPQPLHRVSMEQ